ncbi:hypothetical protein GCM10008943_14230 [Paenochrobactrum glaciei]|uniref:EexN family lipoprotein n=1 Tax=Paenochrobactrum glaciei TaxID=486407 RepID=A0ABN1FY02_9HYPH
MRNYLTFSVVALIAIAQGCSTTTPSQIVRTQISQPNIPAQALKPCDDPVALPDRALSAKELTPLWGKDRAALKECEAKRAALVAAVKPVPTPKEKPSK